MKKVEIWMVAANRALVALLLAVVFVIVFINVVGRYGFGVSISWIEEAARHLMVLCAFSASGLALREGRLVAITTILTVLPIHLQRYLRWMIVFIMFAFMALLCWLGIEFVQFAWNKETMATGISRGIPYMAIPIGCLLFLVHLCFFAKRFTREEFESGYEPESHLSETDQVKGN